MKNKYQSKTNIKKIYLYNFGLLFLFLLLLEFFSGYLIAFNRKPNSQLIFMSQIIKNKLVKKVNPTIKLIGKLKNLGKDVYPNYLYDSQLHHPDNKYWINSPINSYIVHCDEGDGLINWETNNFGYRKVGGIDNPNNIELLFLGDSFTEGACVRNNITIPEKLSTLGGIDLSKVINLGRGGTGPLFQYAILKEFINIKSKNLISIEEKAKLIWIIYGNDLRNLREEKTSKLVRYLEDDFSQNYFLTKDKNSAAQKNFLNDIYNKSFRKRDTHSFLIKGHGYGETLVDKASAKEEVKLFNQIFEKFISISKENDINLIVVTLEDHPWEDPNIENVLMNNVQDNCSEYSIKCIRIKFDEVKGELRPHFDEEGYIHVSEILHKQLFF